MQQDVLAEVTCVCVCEKVLLDLFEIFPCNLPRVPACFIVIVDGTNVIRKVFVYGYSLSSATILVGALGGLHTK